MAAIFQLRILAADHSFYEGDCESLMIPTPAGMVGIWAHHQNMISAIIPGMLSYRIPEQPWQIASVSHGMVKIEDNEVLILVDTAERPEEIDANRARREAARAKEELLQKQSAQEFRMTQATLARALNRLQVKSRYLGSGGQG